MAPVPMINPHHIEGAPGPSLLGTGDGGSTVLCRSFASGVSSRCMKGKRQVAPVPMTYPRHIDGAPGPSLLGTGDGGSTVLCLSLASGVSSRCMKGERTRSQQTGEFHFLTFSCYRRRGCLSAAAAMDLFEEAGNCPSGCAIDKPLPRSPRSPKARDRGHHRQVRIPPEIGATRQWTLQQLNAPMPTRPGLPGYSPWPIMPPIYSIP